MKESWASGQDKRNVSAGSKVERGLMVAKVAFLISLLSTFSIKTEAQDNGKEKIDVKHQIELAQEAIKKIKVELAEKCKNVEQTTNGQRVDRYTFPNGQFAEAAEDGDYFIIFSKDGKRGFYDVNSDGKLDRAVMDNTKASDSESPIKRDIEGNILSMSGGIDIISKSAEITSAVSPEKVMVIELRQNSGEVYIADMEDGKHGIITGEEATSIIENLQTAYTSQLKNVVDGTNNKTEVAGEKTKPQEVKKDSNYSEKLEGPTPPPIGDKPEQQPVSNPGGNSNAGTSFDDYAKAREEQFNAFKNNQDEKFKAVKESHEEHLKAAKTAEEEYKKATEKAQEEFKKRVSEGRP